jgi:hypothetical protein
MSQLPKNKAGQLTIPTPKPKSAKAWITVQMPRSFRNTVYKIAEQNNINVSGYVRKKLAELVDAAQHGKIPKAIKKVTCPNCKETIDLDPKNIE